MFAPRSVRARAPALPVKRSLEFEIEPVADIARLCPSPVYVYIYPRLPIEHAMQIYDITVPIRSQMPIYEGDPGVEIQSWSALAKGDSANVSFLHFGAHTGTHVDAPAHFIAGGPPRRDVT